MNSNKDYTELIKGIYRFKCSIPTNLEFVCIYLLKFKNVNILIDAGLNIPDCSKKFVSALKEQANITLEDVDYCILTHAHADHLGLLEAFKQRNPNIKLVMHEITHETLKWITSAEKSVEIENKAYDLAQQMIKSGVSEETGKKMYNYFLNLPKIIRFQRPDIIVKDGDILNFKKNEFQVFWTPGHSLGHICLYDKTSCVLFSGDHILSGLFPHINILTMIPSKFNENQDLSNILDLYLKSIDRIYRLNPKMIFPSHQEIIYNPHECIFEIKKHHEKRLVRILETIEDDPKTPFELSQVHYGKTLNDMDCYLALNEVLIHLIYLENKGKVERVERDGKIMFFA